MFEYLTNFNSKRNQTFMWVSILSFSQHCSSTPARKDDKCFHLKSKTIRVGWSTGSQWGEIFSVGTLFFFIALCFHTIFLQILYHRTNLIVYLMTTLLHNFLKTSSEVFSTHCVIFYTKVQLISEWNFGVFKSPKKATKYLTDFCPSFIGKKSV